MVANARELRRSSTDIERRFWRALRVRQIEGVKFRRQHPIGSYVVDFCAPDIRLVIELDGGQHAERQVEDERRTRFLESRGYRVLRFWNSDSVEPALEEIWRVVRARVGST
jgi:very-short-patch-repair endonuclease